jgi:glycosyltransferase involved in cell wall biosynthesis
MNNYSLAMIPLDIAVISPVPTHPQDAGNRARIHSMLLELKARGSRVHLISVRMESGDELAMAKEWDGFYPLPYSRPRKRFLKRKIDRLCNVLKINYVCPYQIDDWYDEKLTSGIKEILERLRPAAVIVEYAFMTKIFEEVDNQVLKIVDTHDVLSGRQLLFASHNTKPNWFYTTKRGESTALDRCDVVIAIQKREEEYFKKITQKKVITVGHVSRNQKISDRIPDNNMILFVGSNNKANIHGLEWFITKIFPKVREAIPDVSLVVVGKCADNIHPIDGIELVGKVDDLSNFYTRSKLVINPVQFGSGLKIKSVEAVSFGCPLITTSEGAIGLETWIDKTILVADTSDEFFRKTVALLTDFELNSVLRKNTADFIAEYNENSARELFSILDRGSVS